MFFYINLYRLLYNYKKDKFEHLHIVYKYKDILPNNKMSEQLKKELEKKYNPSNAKEGLNMLAQSINTKPGEQTLIEKNLSDAFKEFEQRTGKPMTYSEMRQMFG